MTHNVALEVLDESQAIVALSDLYDGEECVSILEEAYEIGIFEDEIAFSGCTVRVCVRAHQMSVNSPAGYTVAID